MEDNKLQEMYENLLNYENQIHEQNQRRIRIGIKCIYIIPLVFLFLLFLTGSSKIIFLVLWISSLFIISAYLIYVEYIDYNLQEKLNEIQGKNPEDIDSLISTEAMEKRAKELKEKIDMVREKGGEEDA